MTQVRSRAMFFPLATILMDAIGFGLIVLGAWAMSVPHPLSRHLPRGER